MNNKNLPSLFKVFFTGFLILGFNLNSFSQLVTIGNNPGTSGNAIIGGSTYHAQENLYTTAEIGTGNFESFGTAITRIAFNLTSYTGTFPIVVSNYEIYMKNAGTNSSFVAGTYSLTGYTQVFNGTITFNGVGWTSVDLTTPFVRTAGNNLGLLLIRNNGAAITGTVFNTANGNETSSTLTTANRYNGTVAPAAGVTSLSPTAFRESIQLSHPLANDVSVVAYALGQVPKNLAHSVTALVTNLGTTAKTNLNVTLNVTGANPFTNVQTIASLPSGSSTTVTFAAMATGNLGTNTIAVSVPADDDNTNNTKTLTNQVTAATYSTAYDTVTSAGVGSNTAAIDLAVIFRGNATNTLTSLKTNFSSSGQPYVIKIYSVNSDTPQNLLYTSATLTTAAGPNTVVLPAVAITGDFAVSVNQTGVTNYGCSYESETPQRVKTFYSKSPGTTNTWGPLGAPFKIMLDATLGAVLAPVNLTTFTGVKNGATNKLSWTTTDEKNNRGFEIQRSADGANFSTLEFISSKASNGNSVGKLDYEFIDAQPFKVVSYYRLKQVDFDGKSTISNVVAIKDGRIVNFEISDIYPNPVKENINVVVSSSSETKVDFVITDLTGRIVSQQNKQIIKGETNVQLSVSNLTSGTYLLKTSTNNSGEFLIKKFIKQ